MNNVFFIKIKFYTMDNWNDSDFKLPKANVPNAVFESVKKKVIARRIEAQKNRQQVVIGSALLLVLAVVNIGILLNIREKTPKTTAEQAKIVYDSFFKMDKNAFQ